MSVDTGQGGLGTRIQVDKAVTLNGLGIARRWGDRNGKAKCQGEGQPPVSLATPQSG